jgi:hypothetical protein
MRQLVPPKLEIARVRGGNFPTTMSDGWYGQFMIQGPCGEKLCIISSPGEGPESEGWEHVSVSTRRRLPNWIEMCWVKDLFFEPEECVVQFHPRKSEYVNNHAYCLHMWRHVSIVFPEPPHTLVGVKAYGVFKSPQEAAEARRRFNRGEIT